MSGWSLGVRSRPTDESPVPDIPVKSTCTGLGLPLLNGTSQIPQIAREDPNLVSLAPIAST